MKEFLIIQSLRTAYKIVGSGKQVLLLHGWGCDLETLNPIQVHLSRRYQVCALDLPGFGNTDEPPTVWGANEYADFVKVFLNTIGFDDPIILGHSFGGRVSIVLGAQMPVNKMVLVGSAGIKPTRSFKYHLKVISYKFVKHITMFPLWARFLAPLRERWIQRVGSADFRKASVLMRQILSRVVNEDLRYLFPRIKASVLLIWGENDNATPLRDARLMERLIPNAGLAIIPDTGHYCFLEKTVHFNLILDSFLKDE